jgi:quinol monooxygenase YgiN
VNPVTVVVTFQIKEGRAEEFEHALRAHLPHSAGEETCERFWVYRDQSDPHKFLFFEEWADYDEFVTVQLHRPYRAAYMAATEHLWATPRVTNFFRRAPMPWDADPSGAPAQSSTVGS